jgi:hypothetical protein
VDGHGICVQADKGLTTGGGIGPIGDFGKNPTLNPIFILWQKPYLGMIQKYEENGDQHLLAKVQF